MVTGDTRLQALMWGVGAIREGIKAPRCPPRDLVSLALPFCRNPGERLWLLLACLAGLRRGELLGLRASDWDPETHTLRVERQRRSPQRKNRKPLAVRIDAPDVRKLLQLVIDQPELASSRMAAGNPCAGYLFAWGYKYAAGFLEHLRAKLGAKYFPRGAGWHVCRHWGATELARSGVSVWDLCAWLGDSSPEVAQTYVDMVRGSSVGGVAALAKRHGLYGPRRVSKKRSLLKMSLLGKPEANPDVLAVSKNEVGAWRPQGDLETPTVGAEVLGLAEQYQHAAPLQLPGSTVVPAGYAPGVVDGMRAGLQNTAELIEREIEDLLRLQPADDSREGGELAALTRWAARIRASVAL